MVILFPPASWPPAPRTPALSPGPFTRPRHPKAQCACVFPSSLWSWPHHMLISSHHFRKYSLGDCFSGARTLPHPPPPPGLSGSPHRPVLAFLRVPPLVLQGPPHHHLRMPHCLPRVPGRSLPPATVALSAALRPLLVLQVCTWPLDVQVAFSFFPQTKLMAWLFLVVCLRPSKLGGRMERWRVSPNFAEQPWGLGHHSPRLREVGMNGDTSYHKDPGVIEAPQRKMYHSYCLNVSASPHTSHFPATTLL